MQTDFPEVYDQLRALAGSYFRNRPAGQTLQPTALVNEAYLKMAGVGTAPNDRSHFLAVAATAMRQILIDHARRKGADKRGAGQRPVTVTSSGPLLEGGEQPLDLLALDDLLEKLAAANATQAKIVELRFFGGLTVPEVAEALDTSVRTVERHWRFARAWLKQELADAG